MATGYPKNLHYLCCYIISDILKIEKEYEERLYKTDDQCIVIRQATITRVLEFEKYKSIELFNKNKTVFLEKIDGIIKGYYAEERPEGVCSRWRPQKFDENYNLLKDEISEILNKSTTFSNFLEKIKEKYGDYNSIYDKY